MLGCNSTFADRASTPPPHCWGGTNVKVSLALWPRQAQPRMGRWSIAHGDGSAEPWVRGSSTPQSPKWDGRTAPMAPRSAAPFGAGLCLERAPPGSQSLAGGCIPSPHSGLSMGLTDRRRLQLCYCIPDPLRIGGAGQQAASLLEGGGTERAGPKTATPGNPAQIDARWGPGSTGQYARKPQVEGKPGVAYCTAWTNVAHVSYSRRLPQKSRSAPWMD